MTPPFPVDALQPAAVRETSFMTHVARQRRVFRVLGAPIDCIDWNDALTRITEWSQRKDSRAVYLCNVHSVVTARQDSSFAAVLEAGDMTLADGAPIAWSLRRAGFVDQPRLSGPDVMWRYLGRAEATGTVVSFYGSTEQTLAELREALLGKFPKLRIGAIISPPFRALTDEEEAAYIEQIHLAGTNTLFVGLGCPKQERWMDRHRGSINAVMIGVGAAFAFHAGLTPRAPVWMQRTGMEWLHRLVSEPRRLAVRYLVTNSIFVVVTLRQLLSRSASHNR